MNSAYNPYFERDLASRLGCILDANSEALKSAVLDASEVATQTRRASGKTALGGTLKCAACQVGWTPVTDATDTITRAKLSGECGILKSTIHGKI